MKHINWIASYPKSGNTWLRLFLEAYYLGDVDLNEILSSVGDDRADMHEVAPGVDVEALPIDLQLLARPMALMRYAATYDCGEKTIPLYLKTHFPNVEVNGISTLPEALTRKTVYIVRHPYDVFPSFKKHMGFTDEQALFAMTNKRQIITGRNGRVADFLGSWDQHVESYLRDDVHNVLVVKFEDMRENPSVAFNAIMEHLTGDSDPFKVERALERVKINRLQQQEKETGFVESSKHAKDQFFSGGGKVGKKIDTRIKKHLKRAFGSTMRKLGYLEKARGVVELH